MKISAMNALPGPNRRGEHFRCGSWDLQPLDRAPGHAVVYGSALLGAPMESPCHSRRNQATATVAKKVLDLRIEISWTPKKARLACASRAGAGNCHSADGAASYSDC